MLGGMEPIPAHVPLRALRASRGWTARRLAEALADRGVTVNENHLIGVELGGKTAGPALRRAWAEEFSLQPGDIHMAKQLQEIIAAAGDGESGAEKLSA